MTPQEYDKATPEQQEKARQERYNEMVWWGICGNCKQEIKGLLKDFPKECPHCGFSGVCTQ